MNIILRNQLYFTLEILYKDNTIKLYKNYKTDKNIKKDIHYKHIKKKKAI